MDTSEPGMGISLSVELTKGRTIVIQTHIPRDEKVALMHGQLDRMFVAIDRQEAKYRRRDLLLNLALHEKALLQLTEDFKMIGERHEAEWQAGRKKGPLRLTASEQASRDSVETNIKRYKIEILKIRNEIEECVAAINDVEADKAAE